VAKPGAAVRVGDVVATLHAASDSLLDEGERLFRSALDIRHERPKDAPLIYARVSGLGVELIDGTPLAQRA
jgi:thymidine phosphorylase